MNILAVSPTGSVGDRGEPDDDAAAADEDDDAVATSDIHLLSLSSPPSPNNEASKNRSPRANRRKYLTIEHIGYVIKDGYVMIRTKVSRGKGKRSPRAKRRKYLMIQGE